MWENSIIPNSQYGFRPGLSTFNQIIDIIFEITNHFNDKSILCLDIIFLDLSNAFDSITFKSILKSCYSIGIRNNSLKILENYLFGRKQCIKYNDRLSESKIIISGCPQGGVGSPDLFNISVKDLPLIVKHSKIFQYADDKCILKPIYNQNDVAHLQNDLNSIYVWLSNKNLMINSSKSIHLRITLKNCQHLDIYNINNSNISIQSKHKHLGVIIDNNFSFNDHIDYVSNNALKKWSFIKRLCIYANHEVLLRLYKTYILPIIEYCNICLIPNYTQNMKLEKIQKKITKTICYLKTNKYVKYDERLRLLNLDSLQTRR